MSKAILITGATGKQGGSVIDALLKSDRISEFTILAITRDPSSNGAKKLAAKSSSIRVVQGDMNELEKLFSNAEQVQSPIWGVFSVQIPMGSGQSPQTEEAQGKGLVDEALKRGVNHFVYASVERGGDERSWENPTDVPHFISKHNIEQHLNEKAKASSMTWTILRPVAFMENFIPGFMGKTFGAIWRSALPVDKKIQFISTSDIGYFASQAFLNAQSEKYRNQAIGLAGDEISFEEADKIFKEKLGFGVPATFTIVGTVLTWAMKELGTMFRFFNDEGYQVDIQALRKDYPDLLRFGQWLETKSEFSKAG